MKIILKTKSIAANGTWLVLCLILVVTSTSFAQSVITENTSWDSVTGGGGFYFGQSVTTPDGSSWNNITFNFVDAASQNPYAAGELFLLTSIYTGAPVDLSSSTSGFLASTADIANGEWIFAPEVTLDSNTQYYFYASTVFDGSYEVLFSASDPYPGGALSQSDGDGYYVTGSADTVFTVSGTVAPVPEPTTLALAGLGGLSLLLFRRRK